MCEILLQAIVEKLEALEIALLKQSNAGKDEETSNELTKEIKLLQSEFLKFASAFSTNNEKINGLSEDIRALKVNSGNPIQNQVKHVHHFHKEVSILHIIYSLIKNCLLHR
ncbi:MAG: hypothetical protein KGM16_00015 [Bacteroidota bacterium]|nr:hypothetical protein [Bacteroidota bacterium]